MAVTVSLTHVGAAVSQAPGAPVVVNPYSGEPVRPSRETPALRQARMDRLAALAPARGTTAVDPPPAPPVAAPVAAPTAQVAHVAAAVVNECVSAALANTDSACGASSQAAPLPAALLPTLPSRKLGASGGAAAATNCNATPPDAPQVRTQPPAARGVACAAVGASAGTPTAAGVVAANVDVRVRAASVSEGAAAPEAAATEFDELD